MHRILGLPKNASKLRGKTSTVLTFYTENVIKSLCIGD